MKRLRCLSLVTAVALLLSAVGVAEELGEIDLYAEEIYVGEYAEEAPAAPEEAQPTEAEAIVAAPEEAQPAEAQAVAAAPMAADEPDGDAPSPEPQQPAAVQTVALTGKSATAQMNVDETLQIAVNEGETGRFTSKSPKLARVDENGLVTALAKGTAKIEFKPAGGKKRTLRVKIIDPFEPTGVRIGQGKAITLNLGDSVQLDAALAPETARTTLTWKSDKAKVASVDGNGVVTGLKEGKAKLTVSTANKKKAKITVKVVNPYKPTGIGLAQGNSLALIAGESVQLDAVLAPETARTTLTWKSSKTKVATVDANGCVTAVASGTAKITVKTANKLSAVLQLRVIDPNSQPRTPAMNLASYNGVEFKVVNTAVDPMTCAKLVRDSICTHPGGTDKYSGYCLGFANYYVYCMVDNVTNVDLSVALRKYMTSRKLSYKKELYSNPNTMMAQLYDLLSAGLPQMLMVEAILHRGSRHFVTVVGYRSSVTRREDLRPQDLLIIDSFDGKLESMDPAIEQVDTRVLFKQDGKYRIEAVRYR